MALIFCLIGTISEVQFKFGFRRSSRSPASAHSHIKLSTAAAPVRHSAQGSRKAIQQAIRQNMAGIPVSSICSLLFARSTCFADTGAARRIHSCLPSSDTEGAVIIFMDAIRHTTPTATAGTSSCNVGMLSPMASSACRMTGPLSRTATAPMGISKTPSPPLSI